jgi:hypothetical protein
MRWQRFSAGLLAFLCLVLLSASGLIQGGEGKQVMIVFTTNTEGELNPCG